MATSSVTPEWVQSAPTGASFSYSQGTSASFWTKGEDGSWTARRSESGPVVVTKTSEELGTIVAEYVGKEGVTFNIISGNEPETMPQAASVSTIPAYKQEPTTPTRLNTLREAIEHSQEEGDTLLASALTETFRKEYAAFSQGKSQEDVDAALASAG